MDLNFIYVLSALSQPHLRWGQSGTDVHGRMDVQSFEIPRIYGHHFGTEFGDLDSYSFLRCAVVLLGRSMRSRCFKRLFCSAYSSISLHTSRWIASFKVKDQSEMPQCYFLKNQSPLSVKICVLSADFQLPASRQHMHFRSFVQV